MTGAWVSFSILILVQFLLFLFFASYEKRLSDVPRILGMGIMTGLPFGLSFDLIIGKYFGLSSYALGFDMFFLVLNATLSYGLFAANILLLQRLSLLHFYVATVVITTVYEITSYFFPVWTWQLELQPVEFLVALSVGYFGGAVMVAAIWHYLLRYRFRFLYSRPKFS